MKSQYLVSVIIPLFNSAKYIEKCVRSCLAQTHKSLEVIVVDDGSTDDGLDVVKKIAEEDKRLKVYHKKNGGVSSARNFGINKASGEYVCFVDADDYLEKEFVECMCGYMVDNNADFCIARGEWNDKANRANNYDTNSRIISVDEAESVLLSLGMNVASGNKMYRRDRLDTTRYNLRLFYGEGFHFITNYAHNSKRIVYTNIRLYHYTKVNPESATTVFAIKKVINGEKALFEIKDIIKNDGPLSARAWNIHYCMFCLNAVIGICCNKLNHSLYAEWHKKLVSSAKMVSRQQIGFKNTLKLALAIFAPPSVVGVVFRVKRKL